MRRRSISARRVRASSRCCYRDLEAGAGVGDGFGPDGLDSGFELLGPGRECGPARFEGGDPDLDLAPELRGACGELVELDPAAALLFGRAQFGAACGREALARDLDLGFGDDRGQRPPRRRVRWRRPVRRA